MALASIIHFGGVFSTEGDATHPRAPPFLRSLNCGLGDDALSFALTDESVRAPPLDIFRSLIVAPLFIHLQHPLSSPLRPPEPREFLQRAVWVLCVWSSCWTTASAVTLSLYHCCACRRHRRCTRGKRGAYAELSLHMIFFDGTYALVLHERACLRHQGREQAAARSLRVEDRG